MQRWVWVTGPDYYLDEDGQENPELDPDRGYATDDWWTCHKDTHADDLVLLYRSTIKKDIAYLIRATTDAYPLDEVLAEEFGPGYQCGYEVLQRLPRPIPIAEMKADPVVAAWPALRAAFVKSSWAVPAPVWDRLLELAQTPMATVQRRIERANSVGLTEKIIGDELEKNPDLLRRVGIDFRQLWREDWLGGGVGWADFVGCGRTSKPKVVIELKKGRIGPTAVGQVLRYREALTSRHSPSRPIGGVVIGDSIDRDAQVLLRHVPHLRFVALADLGLECLRA